MVTRRTGFRAEIGGRLIRPTGVSPLPALWSLDNLVINKQNIINHCLDLLCLFSELPT